MGETMGAVPAVVVDECDELAWLVDLLGSDRTGTVRYLARPDLDDLRLLVPTSPRPAASAALRRLHDDRSRSQRVQALAGRLAGRAGLLGRAPGHHLVLPRFELVGHLARRLGEADLVAAVTIGARRRNRKPVLQLIRPDGRVVGFAKVGWSPLTRDLVANEHRILRAISGRVSCPVAAPPPLLLEHWRHLAVAVTAELHPPLVDRRRPPSDAEIVAAIAATGTTAAATTDATGARSVGAGGWAGVAASGTIAEAMDIGAGSMVDLQRLIERHDGVELPMGLWHGDLTPWNLLRRGGTVLVWDWELAGWDRPIGFDLLHQCFERCRRRPDGTNRAALDTVVSTAGRVLAPLELGLDRDQLRAVVDLYLCELVTRELRLADQRWSGPAMPDPALADLGPEVAATLTDRLR
jgi:hypothetical protein